MLGALKWCCFLEVPPLMILKLRLGRKAAFLLFLFLPGCWGLQDQCRSPRAPRSRSQVACWEHATCCEAGTRRKTLLLSARPALCLDAAKAILQRVRLACSLLQSSCVCALQILRADIADACESRLASSFRCTRRATNNIR